MFTFFSRHKCAYRAAWQKAQMAPFFIALITIIIIAMLFTINLNKISLNKVYTANAADAGVLAGTSQFAFTFDQLAFQAQSMYDAYLAALVSINEALDECVTTLGRIEAIYATGIALGYLGSNLALLPFGIGKTAFVGCTSAATALFRTAHLLVNILLLRYILILENYIFETWSSQNDQYAKIRDNFTENFLTASDIARDYAFYNSGIMERLDNTLDINGNPADTDNDGENDIPSQADEFSFFVRENDTSETFCWRDNRTAAQPVSLAAAGITCQPAPYTQPDDSSHRMHAAQVEVTSPSPPDLFQLAKTEQSLTTIRYMLAAISALLIAYDIAYIVVCGRDGVGGVWGDAVWIGNIVIPCEGLAYHTTVVIGIVPVPCLAPVEAPAIQSIGNTATTAVAMMVASTLAPLHAAFAELWDAVQIDYSRRICDNTGEVDDEMLVTITDIDFDTYELSVATSQEHQGDDLGLWRSEYPRITSNARGTFECNVDNCPPAFICASPIPDCCGNVCSHTCSCINGMSSCQAHTPLLVGVDEGL